MGLYWRLGLTAFIHACFGSGAFYHTIALNQIEFFIKNFTRNSIEVHYGVTPTESNIAWIWALLTASTGIGSILSGFAVKYPLEKLGTKNTVMVVKNIVEILSAGLQFLAIKMNSVELLFLGKLLSGYAVVLAMHIPVLLTECAPVEYRGMVSVIGTLGWPFFTNIASILGLRQVLGTETYWPLILLAPSFPSFVHMLMSPLFPSTPKYLHITKQDNNKAEKSLFFYHGPDAKKKIIFSEFDKEADFSSSTKHVGYKEILRTKHLAYPFWLCLITCTSAALCAHDIAQQYSTGLIEEMNVSDQKAPIYTLLITQVPSMTCQIICIILIERVGRKKLLLFGMLLGILANICIFFAQFFHSTGMFTTVVGLTGLFLSTVGPDIGPHPISEVLPGELAPQASRPATSSLALGSGGWVVPVLTTLFFPPLHYYIGAFAIVPLLVSAVIVFFILLIFLPETRGRSVDDVVKTWIKRESTEANLLLNDNKI